MKQKSRKDLAHSRISKGIRGLDRQAHFANDGDLATWRGIHTVQIDRRRQENKRACRGRIERRDND